MINHPCSNFKSLFSHVWSSHGYMNEVAVPQCPIWPSTSLTLWGRVTHICVSKLTIIGSDNGLSPGRRQAIIWTNAGLLLIRPLVINFSEIFIKVHQFLFEKISLKMSSGKWCLFYLGLNELNVTRINFSCAELISGDINMSYIVFFYHFLTVRCCRYLWLKSFFVKDKNLLILYYRQVAPKPNT